MATIPSWPTLRIGNTGKNVSALQCLLNYRNNTALTVDGVFGSKVYDAVIAFQSSRGLSPDGQAGANTLSALVTTVQQGASNNAVRAAQYLLSKFESLTIDGIFGSGCKNATVDFQQKMGIDDDGIIGSTTWQYLFGYDAYPSTGGGDDNPGEIGNIKDYLGQNIFTSNQLSLLNSNKKFYVSSGNKYGIPWQILAAIHYREYKLQKAGPSNGNGPYQIWGRDYPTGNYSDAQFQAATDDAAAFVLTKTGSRDLTIADNVKYAFFAYNGIAPAYKTQAINMGFTSAQANNGEGSPYVMNRFDAKRDPTREPTKSNRTWGQIKTDNGSLSYPANEDYGAYVIYSKLI